MKRLTTTLIVAAFLLITVENVLAVRAIKTPVKVTQPDGTELTILLRGDEFHNYRTTQDGYLIREDEKGFYRYATINASGAVEMTAVRAKNPEKRVATEKEFLKTITQPDQISLATVPTMSRMKRISSAQKVTTGYPLSGSPKSLVILANFKDKAFTVSNPQQSFQNLVTQPGYSANGGTGSAKDYFMSSSYGQFSPDFVVVGPVTLPQTLAYYGTNVSSSDQYPAKMIADACAAADAAGVDFTQYDTDNDGYVDNVFVYYAGYNEAEGGAANTIWPHRWSLTDAGFTGTKTFDGKIVNDYSCTSELKGASGSNMCGIGTFCHEFGHVLGLPDYYNTDDSSINTLNEWDIMDYGAYLNNGCTPPTYSVFSRFFLGWLTPQEAKTPSTFTLEPLYQGTTTPASTQKQAYLLSAITHNLVGSSPSPTEYFMLEYRKKTGWDAYLPAEGLLIWHIDYKQSAWDDNTPNNYSGIEKQTSSDHMRVYLEPTGTYKTTPGTAFTSGSFTPTTWSGTDINRAITEITKTADNITFKLMGGSSAQITATGSVSGFATAYGTPSAVQSLTYTSTGLTGNVTISLADAANFDIKLSTGSTWSKSLTITPVSGAINAVVNIRYNPASVNYHATQLMATSADASTVTTNLAGFCSATASPTAPVVYVGNVEGSLQFAKTKVNSVKVKTLNIRTTDLTGNLTVALSGANADQFAVSTSTVAQSAANDVAGTVITVSYKPVATGSHSATLTISGGGLTNAKVITLSGNAQ